MAMAMTSAAFVSPCLAPSLGYGAVCAASMRCASTHIQMRGIDDDDDDRDDEYGFFTAWMTNDSDDALSQEATILISIAFLLWGLSNLLSPLLDNTYGVWLPLLAWAAWDRFLSGRGLF